MVQISLPENSKTKKGKYFKDKTGSKNLRKVNVYRWDPSSGEGPRIDTYEVDMDNCPSKVLDILNKIKNEIDPTLAYRRSCAHGVCGSCAMNVDGTNTLSCMKSHKDIKDDIRIYPLPHLKVVKDLVEHPACINFISYKLCNHFVTQNPAPEIVNPVISAWKNSKGDLKLSLIHI